MEGVRQLDEFHNLQKQLPPLGSPLAVPTPLAGKLRELAPSELDTFQLVLDHGQLQKVLDNFPGTDLDAAQNIISLMKREFVVFPGRSLALRWSGPSRARETLAVDTLRSPLSGI